MRLQRSCRTALLVLALLLPLAVTTFALAPAEPAAAQEVGDEIARLQRERTRLVEEIDRYDDEIAGLQDELAEREAEIIRRRGAISFVGDDLERAAHARREPARTRIQAALADFTGRGREEFLTEIMVIEGDDTPARRREFYSAVIDDAQAKLDAIDEQLRSLADDLDAARGALVQAQADRDSTEAQLAQAGDEQAALVAELAAADARIEDLKSRQTRALLTGLVIYENLSRPALAVKIDNVAPARPQTGINSADIVFVELVEGGLTRLAAVFHSQAPSEVGPVRSMRTGDFDLLAQFDSPLFANSGGNRITRQYLARSSLVDVGVNALSRLYYRDRSRPAPHNLYTNPRNLWSAAASAGYDAGLPDAMFGFREPGSDPGGTAAGGIAVNYGGSRVAYEWNGSAWLRSQDGRPTVDAAGGRTAPTTVIVQFTNYRQSEANAETPEAITVGEGEAWIFTEGRLVKGRWNRPTLEDTTVYLDGSGNEVRILPGRTWIEMPKPGSASSSG